MEKFNLDEFEDARVLRTIAGFLKTVNLCPEKHLNKIALSVLKGGLSAASLYSFSLHGQMYVLRVLPAQAEKAVRNDQISLAKLAAELCLGPQVYYVDSELEAFVMEYVNGRTVLASDFHDTRLLLQFAQQLKSLHQAKSSFLPARSPFERFYTACSKIENTYSSVSDRLSQVNKIVERIESLLLAHPVSVALTHLDLNPLNIMIADNKFYLVDWVNGGMSDPYFDLATFCVFQNLNEHQKKLFLQYYFGYVPSQVEWARYCISEPVRLFVIAVCYLSLNQPELSAHYSDDSKIPSFKEFLKRQSEQSLDWDHQLIGLIMLKAGLEIIESDQFKVALDSLAYSK